MAAVADLPPFKYQEKFLLDTNKEIAFRSGRQVGKTTMVACRILYTALTNTKEIILIIAPTLRQSKIMFDKIKEVINSDTPYAEWIKSKVIRETSTLVQFDTGSTVHCLPGGEGLNIRGFSPTGMVFEEAAFIKEKVYTSALPSIAATGGWRIYIGTPFGKRGRFYQAFFNDKFSKYHVKSKDNPLITEEFLQEERENWTENEYLQEYEGEFTEEADAYFSHDLVIDSIEELDETEIDPKSEYFMGVDIARFGNDETVYTIGKIKVNTLFITDIIITKKMPVTDVMGRVQELHKKYNFSQIFMDESGLGGGAVDYLKELDIPLYNPFNKDSTGIQFTLINKEEMYKNLKLLFEANLDKNKNRYSGKIKIPKNNKLLMQLTDLQYKMTAAGHYQIHHPERPNAHDDLCDSLALCALALRRLNKAAFITAEKKETGLVFEDLGI